MFELSTEVKSISRGDGRSATAAAAYRACCVIECEREGRAHDYTRKRGLEAAEIVLPEDAPAWARDRAKLWNAAELVERNGNRGANAGAFKKDAQTAREFFFSFPVELSEAGRLAVARAMARHLAKVHGVAADFAIHKPGKDGDERNFHCHLLTSTRRLTGKGFGAKAREWGDLKSGKALSKDIRARIAATINEALKAEGKAAAVHVEHRTFKERGSSKTPTLHQGPAKTAILRKRQRGDREGWSRDAAVRQREGQAKELAALKLRQDFAAQAKRGEQWQRMRDERAAIRRELAEARRADAAPTGLRRMFLIVTGRAGREAFDRQARDGQRVEAARVRMAAVKAELRAERATLAAGQARERAALSERHRRDDRQLEQAVRSREGFDRTAERREREAFAQVRQQEIEHKRERWLIENGRQQEPLHRPLPALARAI